MQPRTATACQDQQQATCPAHLTRLALSDLAYFAAAFLGPLSLFWCSRSCSCLKCFWRSSKDLQRLRRCHTRTHTRLSCVKRTGELCEAEGVQLGKLPEPVKVPRALAGVATHRTVRCLQRVCSQARRLVNILSKFTSRGTPATPSLQGRCSGTPATNRAAQFVSFINKLVDAVHSHRADQRVGVCIRLHLSQAAKQPQRSLQGAAHSTAQHSRSRSTMQRGRTLPAASRNSSLLTPLGLPLAPSAQGAGCPDPSKRAASFLPVLQGAATKAAAVAHAAPAGAPAFAAAAAAAGL